jgi:uncharacterized protein with GYD domain
MFTGSYTREGAAGVLREGGTARRDALAKLFASVGGSMESFYFAFGGDDFFIVGELPDHVSAAAAALTASAAGGAEVRTVVLLTPEEVDAAAKVSVPYRAPGA